MKHMSLGLSWLLAGLFLTVGTLLWSTSATADEIRPAFLKMTETVDETFTVVWKVPARGNDLRLSLDVQFSGPTRVTQPAVSQFIGSSHQQIWQVQFDNGLAGTTISIAGLERTTTETLLQIDFKDGSSITHRFTPTSPRYTIAEKSTLLSIAITYTVLGIEHILLGLDHLLFVLVLLLLITSTRKLVWTITAFTVAHSITLSLAALDIVRVPVPPVEATIALSIVFVAAEILRAERGQFGVARKSPWLVAFSFGLLHGLGFAAALAEIGLPQNAVPTALVLFNVGVEIGQLLFVGAMLLLAALLRRAKVQIPDGWRIGPAYAIGSLAAFWTIERTAAFWS